MAKKKPAIFTPDGTVVSRVPAIKSIRPAGSSLLVEMLNADEILNTDFYIGDNVDTGPPQAYIVDLGPSLKDQIDKGEAVFLSVGDRVLLQGTYVPVPNWDDSHRERGLVEFHNIKAIIEEK
tara:strand:- start:8740 stop:9105 length:366 start_codon:yes stop_codon:yes gene_type:complete